MTNLRHALCLAASVVFAAPALAAVTDFRIDYDYFDGRIAAADGVLSPTEYGFNTQYFSGSGSGAGGVGGASRLYFSTGPAGATFGFQPGAAQTGTLVLMLNLDGTNGRPAGSGAGLTTINDTADAARTAISALRGQWPVGFFNADYDHAMTFNADGVRVWRLPDAAGSNITPLGGYTGATGAGAIFREGLFAWSNIPGSLNGDFTLFAAYVGGGPDGFLYNESIPAQPFTSGPNPGGQFGAPSPANFANAGAIGIFIPAPGAGAAGLLAFGVLARRRR